MSDPTKTPSFSLASDRPGKGSHTVSLAPIWYEMVEVRSF